MNCALAHSIMDSYRYTSLFSPTSQIRLLHLQAGPALTAIKCRLETVQIDDVQDGFEALSYTWGSPEPKEPILIDGLSLSVGPNLFSALNSLRSVTHTKTLWIDADCINQSDVEEKSSQVPIMRKIYHSASRVIVWLGEPQSKDIQAGFNLAKAAETADEGKETIIELLDRNKEGVDGLRDCFLLPYWSRVWIIQELALSHRCVVRCGDLEGSWHGFEKFQRLVNRLRHVIGALREEFFVFGDKAALITAALPKSIEGVRVSRGAEPSISLLEVQRKFRASQCVDPRDTVFGFLGLVQDQSGGFAGLDYSMTAPAVYIRSTELTLASPDSLNFLADCLWSSSRSLEIPAFLSLGTTLSGPDTLPTRVPNWTQQMPAKYAPLQSLQRKRPFELEENLQIFTIHLAHESFLFEAYQLIQSKLYPKNGIRGMRAIAKSGD